MVKDHIHVNVWYFASFIISFISVFLVSFFVNSMPMSNALGNSLIVAIFSTLMSFTSYQIHKRTRK